MCRSFALGSRRCSGKPSKMYEFHSHKCTMRPRFRVNALATLEEVPSCKWSISLTVLHVGIASHGLARARMGFPILTEQCSLRHPTGPFSRKVGSIGKAQSWPGFSMIYEALASDTSDKILLASASFSFSDLLHFTAMQCLNKCRNGF